MDAELRAKWVAALRSGEYEQALGDLFDGRGYCCLGVLCKVMGEEIPLPSPSTGKRIQELYNITREATGIDPAEFFMRNDGSNPYLRHDFSQIADYIEATL